MKHGLAKRLTALFLAMVLVLSCGAVDIVAYATTEGDGGNSGTPAVTENPEGTQAEDVSVNLSVYYVFMGEGEKEYSEEAGTMIFGAEDAEQSLTFAIPAEEGYVYMVSDDEEQAKSVTDNGDGTCTVTFARPEETMDYTVYVYYKNDESVGPNVDYVAWIGETGYTSLSEAVKAAANIDADTVTITLAAGEYSLHGVDDFYQNGYFTNNPKAKKQNLIFVGAGRNQTVWKVGGNDNEDNSFADHQATITFRNMNVKATGIYMCGFRHNNNIVVDNCNVDCSGGTIHYWGNGTATFQNSTFINVGGESVIWAYGPKVLNITGCIFDNITGCVINVFRYVPGVEVNFTGNTVNGSDSTSTMITIADASSGTNQWTVNIADNTVTGFAPSPSTCSKLFAVNEYRTDKNDPDSAYKYGLGTPAIVKLEGKTVWTNGIWTDSHTGTDGDGNFYTYGHAEYPNNIERIYVDKDGNKLDNDYYHNENGVMVRHWVDRCKYCGFVYVSGDETQPTSATVTFKVVNGQWDDGSATDKTVDVNLTGGKGTLTEAQIPSVGAKPNENYKAGSWDVTPNVTADGITGDITYTYTFAAKENYTVSVNYVDESNTVLKQAYTTSVQEGSNYDVSSQIPETLTYNEKNYMKESVTGDAASGNANSDKAITVTYTLDNAGGENGPDNIPDKYQKKVTFKVANGKWNDESAADKVVYVTLEKDGKWDVTGTGALTAPAVGSKPNDGFKAGSWDTTPPATVSGTEDATYTYTYARSTTPIVPGDTVNYIVEHYKAGTDGTYPTEPTESEILGGKIGDTVTATAKTYAGYCLNSQVSTVSGELVKIEDADDIVTLKLYYDIDVVGEDDDDDDQPDDPDNIPDKYQKKVTFKVANGKWNDESAADKVVYVTLEKDGKWDVTGTGALTAPAVGSKPNDGFKAGSWDTTPPATVSGTDAVAYTYTYAKVSVVPVDPSIPQTGDESHILLWGAMMIASMVGMAVLIVSKKRFAYSGKYIR